MGFLAHLWMTVAAVYGIMFYVGMIGVAVVLERHFIKKRSNGEWILPIVCVVLAVVLGISGFHQRNMGGGRLGSQQIMVDNQTVGVIQVVTDDDYRLVAFGKYITNEGASSKYIDLTVDEKGKITASSQPLPTEVRADMEETLSYYKSVNAGSSQPYADLMKIDAEVNQIERSLSWATLAYGFMWYGIPACGILGVYLVSVISRKKRRAFDKARLEDL